MTGGIPRILGQGERIDHTVLTPRRMRTSLRIIPPFFPVIMTRVKQADERSPRTHCLPKILFDREVILYHYLTDGIVRQTRLKSF